MDPRRVSSDPEVNALVKLEQQDIDGDSEMTTDFIAAEQRPTETIKRRPAQLNHADNSDVIVGNFSRTEPINLTATADTRNSGNGVEEPSAHSAGTRSQYHSIQQLSQSGRPRETRGPFQGSGATVYGQWVGYGHPVDLAAENEEDTLNVLRNLLRRYDRYAAPWMETEIPDGRENENDEVASGRASNSDVHGSSLSGEDLDEDQRQQIAFRRSPSTMQAKRARVEHIVNNIRAPMYTEEAATTGPRCSGSGPSCLELTVDGQRRSKRKQTLPQQHDSNTFDHTDHHTVDENISDDDDDDEQKKLSKEQLEDDDRELRQQFHAVQLHLDDMCAKYAKSLRANNVNILTSDSSDDNVEAERLTNFLKEELRQVVDKLVDKLIQRFLAKHFTHRKPQAPRTSLSADERHRNNFPQFPVFPPPPLFSLLPFPVEDRDALVPHRAYADRCGYVDELIRERARTTHNDVTLNYNNSTSGPPSCKAVSEPVDHRSLMSVISSRCLMLDQQRIRPPIQVYRRRFVI